jgi:hypothetical protein
MKLVLVFALLVVVPIALLLWSRRDSGGGERGTDPHANRDLGRHGGPPEGPRDGGFGASGDL